MARCPSGAHRLLLTDEFRCHRCSADLRLYTATQNLPAVFYNEARRLWDIGELPSSRVCLQAAVHVRRDFPEALWLLAAIEAKEGDLDVARRHLARARELGAPVNLAWLADSENDESATSSTQEDAVSTAVGDVNQPAAVAMLAGSQNDESAPSSEQESAVATTISESNQPAAFAMPDSRVAIAGPMTDPLSGRNDVGVWRSLWDRLSDFFGDIRREASDADKDGRTGNG